MDIIFKVDERLVKLRNFMPAVLSRFMSQQPWALVSSWLGLLLPLFADMLDDPVCVLILPEPRRLLDLSETLQAAVGSQDLGFWL